ncbi:MAG: hypothetical protein FJ104_10040, partial [Deltaproteobacteria bacterium]|nr:hypothetical protein [Deltaproteobacteria bacterium]
MSEPNDAEAEAGAPTGSEPASGQDAGGEGAEPTQFGVTRYVHAAMIGVGILGGYIAGNLFGSLWASLAAVPAAARAVPILLRYGEDERSGFTLTAGAAVGLLLTVRMFRDAQIR